MASNWTTREGVLTKQKKNQLKGKKEKEEQTARFDLQAHKGSRGSDPSPDAVLL